MTDITQIHELEYDAILRQAVAVIDRTRAMVATVVCSAIGTADCSTERIEESGSVW